MNSFIKISINIFYFIKQIYWFVFRPRTLGAIAIITDKEGKVLLSKNSYRKGLYLIGGGVKKREKITTALVREVKEETGLKIKEDDLKFQGVYQNHIKYKNDLTFVFIVTTDFKDADISIDNIELIEAGFYDLQTIKAELNESTKVVINDFKNAKKEVISYLDCSN
jgi:8-oxo-dGTP pyrophosphatase MutT (NUDIX family)